MAITYFGFASTPADNGSQGGPTVAVTPPASMVAGDLAIMIASNRATTPTLTVSATGGQTWSSLTNDQDASARSSRAFWARYNGTWSANPSVTRGDADTGNLSVYMSVFRPTSADNTWAVDVAEVLATISSPGSPFDYSIPEITTLTNGALVFASWLVVNPHTWTLQTTPAWANPTGVAQIRNLTGSDTSMSFAWMVDATAGGTGAVVNRGSAGGAGRSRIIAFKEVAPVAAAATRTPMYARRRGR